MKQYDFEQLMKAEPFSVDEKSLEQEFKDIMQELTEEPVVIPQTVDFAIRQQIKQKNSRRNWHRWAMRFASAASVAFLLVLGSYLLPRSSSGEITSINQDIAFLEEVCEMEEEWFSNYEMPDLATLEEALVVTE